MKNFSTVYFLVEAMLVLQGKISRDDRKIISSTEIGRGLRKTAERQTSHAKGMGLLSPVVSFWTSIHVNHIICLTNVAIDDRVFSRNTLPHRYVKSSVD